jgi:hypothetical protein
MNVTPSMLTECVTGKSPYPHAKAVKAVYELLDSLGNNESWQLYVLEILKEGIEAKMNEEIEFRRKYISSK